MRLIKICTMMAVLSVLTGCYALDTLREDVMALGGQSVLARTPVVTEDREAALIASPCPQVEIVDDLSSLSDFTSPRKQNRKYLISRIDMRSAESACKLASNSAIIDLKLVFQGKLGAEGRQNAADKPFFSYPFFIAVTAPNGKIMAKEIFAASMTYDVGETTHSYYEKLRQIIPIRNKEAASHYKILIGFQVTPDQLEYNRKYMVAAPQR